MPTRRLARRSSRGSRRRTTWATVDQSILIAAVNGYQTIDLLEGFKADGGTQQAVTVTRTHLRIIPSTPSTPGDGYFLGLIRGQSTDVGVNIAGAPSPQANLYEDWLLWEHFIVDASGDLTEFGGFQANIDLKSMRRLEELQMNYNLVIEVPAWSTFPATFEVTGRVLLTLP